LNNFLDRNNEIEAVIISDHDGLIIAGEKREDIDLEIVSVLTSIINPILDRIRYEFDFKKFGSCSFETDTNRLIFISVDDRTMISIVSNSTASVEKLSPYGYFLAEKTAQILNTGGEDLIQLSIPNFEYEAEQAIRMKHQLYQLQLDRDGMYNFKFIIIGDHEVGKTSIIRRFVEKRFMADYRATIGLNIISHKFEVFGNKINLMLWDIGAQDYFRRYRKTYYNGAQTAFIVFDVTLRRSFDNIRNWYNELLGFIENKDMPIVIVGNKSDLDKERVVTIDEGRNLCKELSESNNAKIMYIETSALTGLHIEDAFRLISYNFIIKCREVEESYRNTQLLSKIQTYLEMKGKLVLSFITSNPMWNPALQMLVEVNQNQECFKHSDDGDEKYFEYTNGLVLKSCLYFLKEVWDSDGVFCIFDARNMDSINPKWNYVLNKIIQLLKPGKVLVIGILISDNTEWSHLLNQFNIEEQYQTKMGSILFFKIGDDFRSEIFNQLLAMLDAIKNSTEKI
jgi:small GTP-binding protein